MGTVDSNRQARRTGQRTGDQTDNARCINIECVLQPDCGQAGGTNYKHSNENKRLSFTAERIEESGPCLNTDGKNEEHQAEVS